MRDIEKLSTELGDRGIPASIKIFRGKKELGFYLELRDYVSSLNIIVSNASCRRHPVFFIMRVFDEFRQVARFVAQGGGRLSRSFRSSDFLIACAVRL